MRDFKISATGLSINYMPEYIAKEQGYFEEEGLNVVSYVPSPWTKCLTDLDQNNAHAVVGGIWVPIMFKNCISDYISFAKIASRCPLFMVSKTPIEGDFNWSMLEDKRVLVSGGDGASHYLVVYGCAKEGGANVSKIRFIHDFSTTMIYELFEGGFGDVIVLQPDMANKLICSGKGHFMCDLTTVGGVIPWSVYYTKQDVLDDKEDICSKFTLALQRATTLLLNSGGEMCKNIIEKNWPYMNVQDGINTVNLFIEKGMWTKTVKITEDELVRWQRFLVDGDVLDKPYTRGEIVDDKPFEYTRKMLDL